MKKILALALALCMIFALAACGQSAAPAASSTVTKHSNSFRFRLRIQKPSRTVYAKGWRKKKKCGNVNGEQACCNNKEYLY